MIFNSEIFSAWVRWIKDTAGTRPMSLFDHPNVVTGNKSVIPGAVSREVILKRIYQWTVECAEDAADFSVPVWLLNIPLERDECPAISPVMFIPAITADTRHRKIVDDLFYRYVLACEIANIINPEADR